ncbi:MAG: Clp protease N-terminal domain-containing protein, partial [Owenweeksia sp.]
MDENFSPRVKDVISYSKEEALRLGHDYIGTEHLMLGLIREGEGSAIHILEDLGVNIQGFRRKIEAISAPNISGQLSTKKNLPLTRQAEKALKTTFLEAKLFQSSQIRTSHLLLCILRNDDDPVSRVLRQYDVDYDNVKNEYQAHYTDELRDKPRSEMSYGEDDDDFERKDPGYSGSSSGKGKSDAKSKTPVLDNFGRDLTKLAEENKLDPVVGREKEIERVSQILSRRKKNNP